jgi:hypothetical protein
MHALRSRILGRRHVAWLLWLAFLLPLAQTAAAWHALSHTSAELAGESQDGKALHASHCDLCLTGAAVTGGALPGHAPALPVDATSQAAPSAAPAGVASTAPAHDYLSRAPPFASR